VSKDAILIRPDPKCKYCHGSGTVYESINDDAATAYIPVPCDCVEDGEIDYEDEDYYPDDCHGLGVDCDDDWSDFD
jgi:hypothetical protein